MQADGSEERVTSDDVLGVVGAEEEEKQNKFAKKKGSKSKKSKAGNVSVSAPSTPLSSSSPVPTPPPSSPSPQVDAAEEGDEAMPISPENGEEGLEPSSEPDPYDSRVGEFRMMTFFAIRDILKGKKKKLCPLHIITSTTNCCALLRTKFQEKKINRRATRWL